MTLIDAKIKVQHPCPLCDLSGRFPEARIASWCNGQLDILQVSVQDPDELDEVLEAAASSLSFEEVVRADGSALTMSRACACFGPDVTSSAEANNCWAIQPILYYGGWETHRIIAPNKLALQSMIKQVRELGTAEIASLKPLEGLETVRDIGIIPVHFFENLTAKQVTVLVSAYENGLLSIPAKTKMDEVAKKVGMSRSTYGEHLRKAMQKVVENSYPILKLYVGPAGKSSKSE